MNIIKHNLLWAKARTKRSKTDHIVLHHSAGEGTVESFHNYHKNSRGWIGIGYNFVVYKDGSIHEGRGLEYVGAHCTNYNSRSVGICAVGDFTKEKMTEAQKNGIIELVKWLKGMYPKAVIKGHKELSSTACPGTYYPLDEVKNYDKYIQKESTSEKVVNTMDRYKTLNDVPTSYQQTVKKLVDKGVIKGDGNGNINLTEDMCRMLVFVDRMIG